MIQTQQSRVPLTIESLYDYLQDYKYPYHKKDVTSRKNCRKRMIFTIISEKILRRKSFQASACAKRPGFLKNRVTEYILKTRLQAQFGFFQTFQTIFQSTKYWNSFRLLCKISPVPCFSVEIGTLNQQQGALPFKQTKTSNTRCLLISGCLILSVKHCVILLSFST